MKKRCLGYERLKGGTIILLIISLFLIGSFCHGSSIGLPNYYWHASPRIILRNWSTSERARLSLGKTPPPTCIPSPTMGVRAVNVVLLIPVLLAPTAHSRFAIYLQAIIPTTVHFIPSCEAPSW